MYLFMHEKYLFTLIILSLPVYLTASNYDHFQEYRNSKAPTK